MLVEKIISFIDHGNWVDITSKEARSFLGESGKKIAQCVLFLERRNRLELSKRSTEDRPIVRLKKELPPRPSYDEVRKSMIAKQPKRMIVPYV